MATSALTKGTGYWIQSQSFKNTVDHGGNWDWYIGQWRQDYWNDNEYGAGCVAYSVPQIADVKTDRTVSVPCSFVKQSGACKAQAVLSTTAPSGLGWRYGPTSGVISNEITFSYSDTTLTFELTDGVDISGKTIYLYLYTENSGYGTNGDGSAVVSKSFGSATLEYTEGGMVYIGGVAYMPHIGNGTSWDACIPYIGNGTSWEMCG